MLSALHLRRLRDRPLRVLLAVGGIAVAVTLVVAVFGFHGSLTGSVEDVVDQVAGIADLEVVAPVDTGIDESLAGLVAGVPGVRAVAPLVFRPVMVGRTRGLLVGGDVRALVFTPRLAPRGRPVGPEDVYAGEGLARQAGRQVTLWVGGRAVEVVVAGVVRGEDARRLNGGAFLAAALPRAQQLAGRPETVDTVLVDVAHGSDVEAVRRRIEEAVAGQAVVASPRERVDQAMVVADNVGQALTLGSALALVVAGFLVFNTMGMAAAERRPEIATLRALGGRRGRLLRAFLAEAAVLGLAGGVLGAALGVLAARALVDGLPASLVSTVGVVVRFHLPAPAVPVGIALGAAAAVAAAYLPARRVVRVPPVDAMRPEGVAPPEEHMWDRVSGPLLVAGIGATGLSSTLAFRADNPRVLFAAVGIGVVGLVAVARAAASVLVSATARIAASLGAPGRLAAASIERNRRRVWATTAAVFLALGMAAGQGAMVANVRDTATRRWAALAATDLVLQPGPPESLPAEIRMPAAWEGELSAIDGVASVRPGQFANVTLGSSRVLVDAVAPHGRGPELVALGPAHRALVVAGQAAIVTKPLAQRLSLEEGDDVTLPTPGGPRSLPIVEVIDLPLSLEGAVIVGLPVMRAWFGRDGASRFEIDVAPGASVVRVREALERFAGRAPFPVWVFTGGENLGGIRKSVDDASAALAALQWVIVLTAALSVLNTLVLSVIERRRELGILRAMGATRRLLAGAVMAEAVAIAAVGAAVGVAFGLYFQYIGVTVIDRARGLPVDFAFASRPVGLAVLAAAVLCVVGSLGPARRAARLNVVEAIGYE